MQMLTLSPTLSRLAAAPVAAPASTANAPAADAAAPARKAKADPPGYTGPADEGYHYDAKAARWMRPLNHLLVGAMVKKSVAGAENMPQDGPHMVCFNHQAYADPPLVASLDSSERGFMAAKEQFVGFVGQAMTAMGAFPVDRGARSTRPIDVAIDVLDSGKGVCIFPEGGIHTDGAVHELKEGAAMIALRSKCETIVPGAIHYQDQKVDLAMRLEQYAAATGVAAAGLAAAVAGGPVVQVACGIVTGLLTGAAVGAGAAFARTPAGDDIKMRGMAAARGAAVGALSGALAGGLGAGFLGSHALVLAAPLSVGAGLTTLGLAKGLAMRPEAHVAVGRPIAVEPYRQMANQKEARSQLTSDLHQAIVELKTGLENPQRDSSSSQGL